MANREEQAARWFAASRRGLMTQDERAAYDSWRSDPTNAAVLADLQRIWLMLEPARPTSDRPTSAGARIPGPARLAAMLSAASLAIVVLSRLDGPWWTTLDWWSR